MPRDLLLDEDCSRDGEAQSFTSASLGNDYEGENGEVGLQR